MTEIRDGKPSGVPCPDCGPGTILVVRTNSITGGRFLACPRFPLCRHTEAIPESIRMKLAGEPSLFDLFDEGDPRSWE